MSAFTDLLANPDAEKRFLVVLKPFDLDANKIVTLYYSTHGFTSGPGDNPANTYFAPRVTGLPAFPISLFAQGKLSGASQQSEGTLRLANPVGGLDAYRYYSWTGRSVQVLMGGRGFALADYGVVLNLTVRAVAYDEQGLTFTLRDASFLADQSLYAGQVFVANTDVDAGSDLAGRVKPRGWGACRNVSPIYLGASSGKPVFSVGSDYIVGVLAVYDRGVPLAFVGANPAAGQYTYSADKGLIYLGSSFVGPVTCDVVGRRYLALTSTSTVTVGTGSKSFDVSGMAASQIAQISVGMRVRAMATGAGAAETLWMDGTVTAAGTTIAVTVDSSRGDGGSATSWFVCPWCTAAGALFDIAAACGIALDEASRAALNAAQPATIDFWLPEGGNGQQLLDAIADAAGCYWCISRAGLFQAGRIDVPGTASASIVASQVLYPIERLALDDPSFRFTVRYRRNWTVMTTDQIAGSVDAATRLFLTQEWRQVTVTTSYVTSFPYAPAVTVESIFDDPAVATAERNRLVNVFGYSVRDYFRVRVKSFALLDALNRTVNLTYPRFGLNAGFALRVIDLSIDLDAQEIELGLWG